MNNTSSDTIRDCDLGQTIAQMGTELKTLLKARGIDKPCMIGIHTGGVWVAEHLYQQLAIQPELGTLNISFYRDDFSRIGVHPQVQPSNLPFNVDDQHIILVDDVLQTGRTIRAALNEIFDYGRPASVILVTLVDRCGQELPIQADVTGLHINLKAGEQIKLEGPEKLKLSIQTHGK